MFLPIFILLLTLVLSPVDSLSLFEAFLTLDFPVRLSSSVLVVLSNLLRDFITESLIFSNKPGVLKGVLKLLSSLPVFTGEAGLISSVMGLYGNDLDLEIKNDYIYFEISKHYKTIKTIIEKWHEVTNLTNDD